MNLELSPAANSSSRRRFTWPGCIGAVLVGLMILLGCGGAFIGIGGLIFPDVANFSARLIGEITGVPVPETQPVSGDPAQFDPIAQYDAAAAFAGAGAQLVEFSANFVQSDGTVNLTAANYVPWVRYKFVRPTDPPANAPPIGTGGNSGGDWYEPVEIEAYQVGQRRTTSVYSGSARIRFQWVNMGLTRQVKDKTTSVGTILEAPRCSLAKLWNYALSQDVPAEAVAIIQYDANGYDFSISGTPYRFRFDQACQPQ
jgi:hypothetical protein